MADTLVTTQSDPRSELRLLFVSNFYPPYDRGGYEKHCHEVAIGLQARGHTLFVLTSSYGVPEPMEDVNVSRSLFLESDLEHYSPKHLFLHRWHEERTNVLMLPTTISEFKPDAIVFWGMWNLSRKLPAVAEKLSVPVVYYLEDLWPISPDIHTRYWQQAVSRRQVLQPLVPIAKLLASLILKLDGYPPKLRFEHAVCGSRFLRERLSEVIPAFEQAEVVMCGIDLEPLLQETPHRFFKDVKSPRLVYVGTLGAHKGVHTALESIPCLLELRPDLNPVLTIVGAGNPAYGQELRSLVAERKIKEHVRFVGSVPTEQVPAILAEHDILVVPSVWEEPFGRVVVEGMAAGLVVVGTATGGSAEILTDDVNGLVFPPEDSMALAECFVRLIDDPALYERLAAEGKKTSARFDLSYMIDGIEDYLLGAISAGRCYTNR